MKPKRQGTVNRINLEGAIAAMRAASSFTLTTHINPDGDAIGSLLALEHFLGAIGKRDIDCVCHDPVPRIYEWLPGAERIKTPAQLGTVGELVIVIDVAQFSRIGSVAGKIPPGHPVLVLDHHLEDSPSGTLHYIDPGYAAAAEIVVDLYEAAGVPMSREAAECAYVGLTTDTGGFRYANTNARAHERAARLLKVGIDVAEISGRCFDVISTAKLDLLRHVLDRMVMEEEGRVAWSYLDEADLLLAAASHEDTSGLVNFARNIEGVDIGILLRQAGPNEVKLSMRSRKGINSAQLLKPLGGGGHAGAAGATLKMDLNAARAAVLDAVHAELQSPRIGATP